MNVNTKSLNSPMVSNIVVFTLSTDSTNCLTVCSYDIAWFTVIIFKGLPDIFLFQAQHESLFDIHVPHFIPMILLSVKIYIIDTI
jgi:hypothetical protein